MASDLAVFLGAAGIDHGISLLIQGAPELELHYTHRRGDALARLDTEELHALLGPELSLAEPELILWIRDYLQEQEALLQEQKGM